jgi:hypothetical protein
MHHRHAIGIAGDALEMAVPPFRPHGDRTFAQPFVELGAVDHADIAAIDGHMGVAVAGRNDAGGGGAGHQQMVGNGEVTHQHRRHGTAAGLDAPGAVQHQHGVVLACQVGGGGGTGRPTADHHHVECFEVGHRCLLSWRG